ncbi:MAG: hypothetical protein HKL88_05675, partial [Bacteroidia bacterium]|nr:hypothetical protein [Bacteroidia bacterium]
MRRITFPLLLCLTLFSLPLAAQDWVGMMRDPHANVHAVQQAFNRWYSQTHKTSKPGTEVHAPNGRESEEDECNELFRRWEWFNVPRAAPNGTRADFNLVGREYHNYLIQHPVQAPHQQGPHNFQPGGTWTYVGNTQVPTNSNTGFGGDGRVNRIRFMPGNSNIMFACAASGGLWKSTNGGSSWSTNTDQLGDLTTSDVAINPLNTNIMYLATGDGDGIQSIYPDPATIGVLKSTDGGLTWNATSLSYTLANAGANYYSVNELIIDPSDTAVIIAATTMGIYRTANSGSTWTLAGGTGSGNATWFHSIAFHPGNPNVVYACTSNVINGIGGNFFRSVNNGVSWTNITNGLPSNATAEGMALAVTPADTSLVYVLADRTGTYDYQGLYVSNNDGVSFTMQSGYPTQPNILGNNDAFGPGFGYGQGWYDLTLAVSPTNKDSIMVGGVDTYLSTDGGVTWAQSSDWLANGAPFVHADIHHIEPVPGNSLGFAVACDGGAFITTNGGPNFSDISNNLEIAQQYSIGPSATVAGRWITGWQDNGTNLSTAPWAQVLGGDGMVCFIDWSVPGATTFYAENPNGALQRSTNSGGTWSNITTGITEAGPWVTQWCQDPKTAATLYSGFRNVWKSTNSGGSWTRIGTWGTSSITALAVDSANPAYIYAAQSNMIQYTTNGGASWTNITGTLPVGSANITGIAVKSKSPSHVWVTFSGYSSG